MMTNMYGMLSRNLVTPNVPYQVTLSQASPDHRLGVLSHGLMTWKEPYFGYQEPRSPKMCVKIMNPGAKNFKKPRKKTMDLKTQRLCVCVWSRSQIGPERDPPAMQEVARFIGATVAIYF